jgi:transcription antitermination factor NusG
MVMDSWTLLRLNAQNQTKYLEQVQEHMPDVETYFPTYEKITRPHGRRQPVVVIRPVYPGYVFAKLDISGSDIRLMISLPVRARFIKFGGNVSTIPERVIHELRRLESLHLLVREIQRISPYAPGVKVRIHTPIADIQAIVIALVHGKRIRVDSPLGSVVVPIHQVSLIQPCGS